MVEANGPFGRWVGRARVCDGGFRTRRVRPIKPGSAPERHEVTKRRGLIDADGSAIQWLYCEIANGRNCQEVVLGAIDTARAAHRHVALDLMVVARSSSPPKPGFGGKVKPLLLLY